MRRTRRHITRRGLVMVLLALTLVGVGVGVTRASHNFTDVLDADFFHDAVDFLASRGITAGIGGGLYGPDQAVTRGQMAVFIERALSNCPPDSVRVGAACIDTYEASVWETTDADLIRKIQLGTATLAELQAGGTQRGATSDNYGLACPDNGNGCMDLYAVSIPGVTPSRFITWFQALAVARNSGKRLPFNQEWQAAAFGTPDGAPCVVGALNPGLTGTPGCRSDVGVFDAVGNLFEWVANWAPITTTFPLWPGATFGNDLMAYDNAGAGPLVSGPAPLLRGGDFNDFVTNNGVFSVQAALLPDFSNLDIGFRAAR